jgi:hypothetical protein
MLQPRPQKVRRGVRHQRPERGRVLQGLPEKVVTHHLTVVAGILNLIKIAISVIIIMVRDAIIVEAVQTVQVEVANSTLLIKSTMIPITAAILAMKN